MDPNQQARIAGTKNALSGAGDCCGTEARERERPSIVIELHRQALDADTRGTKAKIALDFFEKHPEFAEFIGLIRAGVIGI